MSKPGFMFYHDDYHALAELDDASFRRVIDAMAMYSETGEVGQNMSTTERVIFKIMQNSLDRDDKKYQKRVEAGKKGGERSGEVRRNNAKQTEANRSKMNDCEANRSKRTNSNSNSNSNPNPNSNAISLSERGENGGEREIPSVEEVKEYAKLAGLEVNADVFVAINSARGWRDSMDRPIRDWRMWLENSPLARKEEIHAADAEPDRAGQRDEYGGEYL